MRDEWFNVRLYKDGREKVWEEEWETEERESRNEQFKKLYDKQTEDIILGKKLAFAPDCEYDMR